MNARIPQLSALVLLLFLSASTWAKGVTVEIVVSGADLPAPLSITDPAIVQQFSIWSGPNSRYRIKDGPWQTDYSRIYIDFPGGTVDPPPVEARRLDVVFHIARMPGEEPWDETYRVQYTPRSSGGYIYLPVGNPFIHHGVEGNWFRSTDAWEASVRPLVLEWLNQRAAPAKAD